jgi:uncharacterized protein (DUF849 family)
MYINGEPASKMIIQLAPTGIVPDRKDSPYVPLSPDEIARDAYKAYKLGASVIHVHARDGDGRPTYKKEIYREIISAVRGKCPDMIICASTSGRTDSDIRRRMEVLELKPDMASLTLGSVNFSRNPSINSLDTIETLARTMSDNGIKPELEIFEPGFINIARYLTKKGYLMPHSHFNLLLGSLGSIPADVRDLVYLAESLPEGSTWSATGIGRFQLQVNATAIIMGGHVRVGLEDSLFYDRSRSELATNEDLVKRVVGIADYLGREIATPKEAREILGLNAI